MPALPKTRQNKFDRLLVRSMNYEIARKLLIDQTSSPDNPDTLLSRLQQGKPPVPGQVTSTLLALKVVFEALKTAPSLDRELVFALYPTFRTLNFHRSKKPAK